MLAIRNRRCKDGELGNFNRRSRLAGESCNCMLLIRHSKPKKHVNYNSTLPSSQIIAQRPNARTESPLVEHRRIRVEKMPHSTANSSLSPDGTCANSFDYIVVGAGIAGSALASRLHQRHPRRSVLLIEAGKTADGNPLVPQPLVAPMLRGGELDWKYESTPQEHLDGRRIYEAAGKALGGGSVINYGTYGQVVEISAPFS